MAYDNSVNINMLITGIGGPSGHVAVAALKRRGFTVTAVDMRQVDHEANYFYQVPSTNEPSYIDALWGIIKLYEITWLFPTVSKELVLIADQASVFRKEGVVLVEY